MERSCALSPSACSELRPHWDPSMHPRKEGGQSGTPQSAAGVLQPESRAVGRAGQGFGWGLWGKGEMGQKVVMVGGGRLD